jgi:hypothetical protein
MCPGRLVLSGTELGCPESICGGFRNADVVKITISCFGLLAVGLLGKNWSRLFLKQGLHNLTTVINIAQTLFVQML